MAWTYFTANLSAGQIITREQRNELYDALDERLQAVYGDGNGLHADMSGVRTSDPITARVKLYDGSIKDIAWCLDRMVTVDQAWASNDTSQDLLNLHGVIATALGITTSQLTEVWGSYGAVVGQPVESARLWNALREGIRALSILRRRIADGSATTYTKSGSSSSSWASARDACLGDSESSAGSDTLSASGYARHATDAEDYVAQQTRSDWALTIPGTDSWAAGWRAWCFMTLVTDVLSDQSVFTIADQVVSTTQPGGGFYTEQKIATGTDSYVQGATAADLRMESYDSSSEFDAYSTGSPPVDPDTTVHFNKQASAEVEAGFGFIGAAIYLRPNWVHN